MSDYPEMNNSPETEAQNAGSLNNEPRYEAAAEPQQAQPQAQPQYTEPQPQAQPQYAEPQPQAQPQYADPQYRRGNYAGYSEPMGYDETAYDGPARYDRERYGQYQRPAYQDDYRREPEYTPYRQTGYDPYRSQDPYRAQQPQTPYTKSAAPAYHDLYQAPQEQPRKKKRVGARVIAWLLVICILGGAGGFFFSQYKILTGSNGTLFSVVKRGDNGGAMTQNEPSAPPAPANSPISTAPVASTSSGNPDGPKMEITEAPARNAVTSSNELSVAEIADKCLNSVVGITASVESAYYGLASSVGTGIIMTTDGYIITNKHVISGATYIVVTLMDQSTHEATLVGADERSDLAVLKIDGAGLGLVAAEFGDSDALVVGDPVVAIGNPLGLDFMGTVTNGIVSAINRNVVVEERNMTLIQTNAAINSGNSGGPLINKYGQVIGINTLKMQDYSTTVEGLGFAIPTNTAKDIIDELIEFGYVKGRPALGIRGRNIDAYTKQRYNVPYGVLVYSINTLSNAYQAGLRPGDIITRFNGEEVRSVDEINSAKADFVAGDTVTVTYYRDGSYQDITFALNDEALLDAASETTSGGNN